MSGFPQSEIGLFPLSRLAWGSGTHRRGRVFIRFPHRIAPSGGCRERHGTGAKVFCQFSLHLANPGRHLFSIEESCGPAEEKFESFGELLSYIEGTSYKIRRIWAVSAYYDRKSIEQLNNQ